MNNAEIEKIRKLAVIGICSDDNLMQRFVLKGGNALNLIYNIRQRSSLDLDFSVENEFNQSEVENISKRMEKSLKSVFAEARYTFFDFCFEKVPPKISKDVQEFWGGYIIEFKVIKEENFENVSQQIDTLRVNATEVGPNHEKIFRIDVSLFEYCKEKQIKELEGYNVYVYTPEMLAFEKLRAICQQMDEYREIVKYHKPRTRARDFFDLVTLFNEFTIDLKKEANKKLLQSIFEAKRVPLKFLTYISKYRDFHKQDFTSVRDTVTQEEELKEFDYYFDFVIGKVRELESLGII